MTKKLTKQERINPIKPTDSPGTRRAKEALILMGDDAPYVLVEKVEELSDERILKS